MKNGTQHFVQDLSVPFNSAEMHRTGFRLPQRTTPMKELINDRDTLFAGNTDNGYSTASIRGRYRTNCRHN